MKNKLNDTMHFQGILNNPTTPKLILFQRQTGGPLSLNRHRENPPGIMAVTENSYMQSGAGKTPNGTFFKEFSPPSAARKSGNIGAAAAAAVTGKSFTNAIASDKKNGAQNYFSHESGMMINTSGGDVAGMSSGLRFTDGMNNFQYDRHTESRMWREFHQHFS